MARETVLVLAGCFLGSPALATAQVVIRTHLYDSPSTWSLGHEATALGDVDNDGVADYAIAAPAATVGNESSVGIVQIYSGASGSKISTIKGTAAYQDVGTSIDAAGDVNADGTLDIVIGERPAPLGAISVYQARPPAQLWRLEGTSIGGDIGSVVRGAGDLNGDGKDDVLASHFAASPQAFNVTAFNGPTGATLLTMSGAVGFGFSLDGGVDVTGDGTPEILIGVPHATVGGVVNHGRIELWEFGAASPKFAIDGAQPGARFGSKVSFGGDVDGDGTSDFAVQAIDEDNPNALSIREGAIHVFDGAAGQPLWTYRGRGYQSMYNGEIDFSHDLDGDGVTDVLAGFASEHLGVYLGAVRVLRGSTGVASSVVVESDLGFLSFLGHSVTAIGDIDQDGRSDFIAGYGSGAVPQGAIVYGSTTCAGTAFNFGGADPASGIGCLGSVGLQCSIAPPFGVARLTAEGCFSANGRAMLYPSQSGMITSDGALILMSTQLSTYVLPGGCPLLIGPTFPVSIAMNSLPVVLPMSLPAPLLPVTIYVQGVAWDSNAPTYDCLQVTTTSALQINFQ